MALVQTGYTNDVTELELEEIFVIENGFDSNDNIEVTVHGQLPTACFKVQDVLIQKTQAFEYSIKAFIKRKNLSGCVNEILNSPVNFSKTITLGELPAGEYTFNYKRGLDTLKKQMTITPTIGDSIDDNFYAPISSAFIPDLINVTPNAQVVLSGIFHSNCFKLMPQDIKVIKQGNIFIIIPKAKLLSLRVCKTNMYSINQIVNLGEITAEGHYMVHIRSLSGLSVNKVFHVKKRYNPTGNSITQ
jgi:hypothetical protein